MRTDVWKKLADRFAVGILEFYASTEVSVVLANADGKKPGSLGRPLPGSRECFIGRFDLDRGRFDRDAAGHVFEADPSAAGVLLAKIEPVALSPLEKPPRSERGATQAPPPRTLHDVRETGDTWFVTGDLMRRDADGDHWLVDRLSELIVTEMGPVASRAIEDALYTVDAVALCAVYGVPEGAHQVPVAAIVLRDGRDIDARALVAALRGAPTVAVLPRYLRHVERIPLTDGYRPIKDALRVEPVRSDGRTWRLDSTGETFDLV
jgi:putative long chain acyl-CoA synthase